MKKFLVLIVLFLSTFYSCNKDEEITQKDPVIDLEYLSKDIEGYREVSDEGYVSGKANAFTCYYTPTKNIKANSQIKDIDVKWDVTSDNGYFPSISIWIVEKANDPTSGSISLNIINDEDVDAIHKIIEGAGLDKDQFDTWSNLKKGKYTNWHIVNDRNSYSQTGNFFLGFASMTTGDNCNFQIKKYEITQ
jgi:hypothetical protein